ncbi:pirin family protein [Paraburkholderia sp. BCC1886]|uniref:pirin family protein n=1 Tax=Paraburkholderia sp. BCC1886 TaxID=2562670 RepID=UPI00118279E5|nr:pirin family protein [Paraburkholderia sp. BCC1886]
MLEHRPYESLGGIGRDWLKARLHFRFGELGRPEHDPLGALYIWNDDEFAPLSGFGMHPHRNVEIVTYVCDGAITHVDNVGNAARIEAGNVQVMSAGSGVLHSERNEEAQPTRLFQIWLAPRSTDGKPRWATRRIDAGEESGRFAVLASGEHADVRAGALFIDADARVLGMKLRAGDTFVHAMPPRSQAYLVTTIGRLDVAGVFMAPRDGLAVSERTSLTITAVDDTAIVMVQLLAPAHLDAS